MKNLMLIAGLAAGFGSHAAMAAVQPQVVQPAVLYSGDAGPDSGAAGEDEYAAGNRAMNEQRWQDAIAAFDKVIAAKGAKTDAALYWKAYALNKIDRRRESASTCDSLRSGFPKSSWNKDCSALNISARNARVIVKKNGNEGDDDFEISEIPPVPSMSSSPAAPAASAATGYRTYSYSYSTEGGRSRESSDPDTDLKLLALNALMHQDATKAIPVLRGIFTGNQPERVKRQAMFVLAQNKSPECQALLREIALGKQNPTLQREAIQQLAISQGKKANDTIAQIYKQSTDEKVKRSAISAMFISGDAQQLVELARGEKDLGMKRNIVQQLAIMNDKQAEDYMLELLK